ncbi:MAG: preprotein translocase subunit SecE [Actinobacteria bacterium]|jgi:preprotein translocase subunit SecE|nr:preprotein translocase subunit SecE [Actinomycetota bacterium]
MKKAGMTDTDVSHEPSGGSARPRKGPFGRLALFIRQIIVELRKVIWPTRKELIAYTIVVIVFVSIIASIIAGFDYVFTKVVLFVFG